MNQHLLAGTRVTSNRIHLGTYYGMLRQLNDLSISMKVSFILCDLQSGDIKDHSLNFDELRKQMLHDLRTILSKDIDIYVESKLSGIAELGIKISTQMTRSMIDRISAIKGAKKDGTSPSLGTAIYPSMMTANMLAIGANHLFNRPETKFQPVDLMNELIRKSLGPKYQKFKTIQKKDVKIPAINGKGVMSRMNSGQGSIIEIVNITSSSLKEILYKSFELSNGISPLVEMLWQLEFGEPLGVDPLDKDGIIEKLSKRILSNLPSNNGYSETDYTVASKRVKYILDTIG